MRLLDGFLVVLAATAGCSHSDDPEALLEDIAACVDDGDSNDVACRAFFALGSKGEPYLDRALASTEHRMRLSAISLLELDASLAERKLDAILDQLEVEPVEFPDFLVRRMGPRVLPRVVERARVRPGRDAEPLLKLVAAMSSLHLADARVEQAAKDADPRVRAAVAEGAAFALRVRRADDQAPDRAAARTLLRSMQDDVDPDVRRVVVEGLKLE